MPLLVIGLGNPGGEYARTRHNVGWECLEVVARRGRFGRERREGPARIRTGTVEGVDVVLARPQTYMNLSGRAANHLTRVLGTHPRDAVVVHDDVDLALGRVQVRRDGGHAGNNGVRSVADSWRTRDFLRVRIGVGRPPDGVDTADHVLDSFTPEERRVVDDAIARAADAVLLLAVAGEEEAMQRTNRRAPEVAR